MTLNMLGSINGKVVDINGNPVKDASVMIVYGANYFPDIASLTNSEGKFSIDCLSYGKWVLSAYGPDGETGKETVTVNSDSVTTVIHVQKTFHD